MDRLAASRVILFGVGGVGSWCAEALVRSGVGHLTVVDPDVICDTNVNRQLQAAALHIGKPKAQELCRRLLEINPDASVDAVALLYDETTAGCFELGQYDYVLDAIDTLKNKVLLLHNCLAAGVKVFAAMGAAAKLDPTQIRTAPLSRTRNCPLARLVRKRLRQRGADGDPLCVYSEEMPRENQGGIGCEGAAGSLPDQAEGAPCPTRIRGTVVHVTAPFGFALAGLVIQDVAGVPRDPL